MKRKLMLMLVLTLSIALLVACGGEPSIDEETTPPAGAGTPPQEGNETEDAEPVEVENETEPAEPVEEGNEAEEEEVIEEKRLTGLLETDYYSIYVDDRWECTSIDTVEIKIKSDAFDSIFDAYMTFAFKVGTLEDGIETCISTSDGAERIDDITIGGKVFAVVYNESYETTSLVTPARADDDDDEYYVRIHFDSEVTLEDITPILESLTLFY